VTVRSRFADPERIAPVAICVRPCQSSFMRATLGSAQPMISYSAASKSLRATIKRVVVVVVVATLSPFVASAQDDEAVQEARARFELAQRHFDSGDFALALSEFDRVYELMRSAATGMLATSSTTSQSPTSSWDATRRRSRPIGSS